MDSESISSGRLRIARLLLWPIMILPFGLSLIFHTIGPAAQQPTPGPERPALAFRQYLVDLGKAKPSAFVFAHFSFTNRGSQPVHITSLEPSCGCLNPKLEKHVYQPGESGRFFLRVQTAAEGPGKKEYFCKVKYKDPQPREVNVTFRVQLPERQVTVRPKSLIFYQFGSKSQEQEIVISDYRERPLQVRKAECRSNSVLPAEFVSLTIGTPERGDEGGVHTPITATIADDIPPGRYPAWIVLETDDADYPELRVPLLVQRFDGKPTDIAERAGDHTEPIRRRE